MKKTFIALLISLFIFVIGVACAICGAVNMSISGWNEIRSTVSDSSSFSAEEITSIVIDCHESELTVLPSETNEITVSYRMMLLKFESSVENGTLKLKTYRPFLEGIHFSTFSKNKITLHIPQDHVCDISIDSDVCSVNIDGITVKGDIDAEVDAGAININKLSADSVTLSSDTGAIKLVDCTVNSFSGEADVGAIKATNLSSQKISVKTDVGAIDMSLCGKMSDYTILCSASLSSCNLPQQQSGGSRSLTVSSDVGAVNVTFDE